MKTTELIRNPMPNTVPEYTQRRIHIANDIMACQISIDNKLLPDRSFNVLFIDNQYSIKPKGGKTVSKKVFEAQFNQFVQAVAAEFNITVEGYMADEMQL